MYAVVKNQKQQQQYAPLPLILFVVKQILCHVCLTTLLASTATAAATATPTATATMAAVAQTSLPPTRGNTHIINVQTNCTRDLFEIQLTLNSIFRGLLYTKDFPLECRRRGNAVDANITLRIPTSGCGVRAEPLADGGMEYTVRVMLQMEQKLRQSTDILRTVHCVLPATAMGMSVPDVALKQHGAQVGSSVHRNARMRNMSKQQQVEANETNTTPQSASPSPSLMPLPSPPPAIASVNVHVRTSTSESTTTTTTTPRAQMDTPRVRIWLELGGPNGSGSVEVGVATTLTVRAIVPGTIGVRVVDCAALDGLGESTQQLLDERGCPIDEQVMPALHTRFKPAEEGWSKQEEEDFVEKTFTATFPAFKFPDRERLHVSCGVQLCKGKCPNLNCRRTDQVNLNNLSSDKHLARIEVFNSLAVTAPQIELERLRHDRRYNMSVEEYAPNVRPLPSEGTLCLSISKLAISFCVLGLIFLIAVIVALTSLIRTRRRAAVNGSATGGGSTTNSSSRMHRTEICTSMFSSSSESAQSARFGSKLFIPYYPNTLPYGRVY